MTDFSDEDIELSVESDDDVRFTITIVRPSGKKLTLGEMILELELWIKEVSEAEAERNLMGGELQ